MGMLAKLLQAKGDFDGARLLMGRAYDLAAKNLGESHAITVDMRAALNGLMMNFSPPQMN